MSNISGVQELLLSNEGNLFDTICMRLQTKGETMKSLMPCQEETFWNIIPISRGAIFSRCAYYLT